MTTPETPSTIELAGIYLRGVSDVESDDPVVRLDAGRQALFTAGERHMLERCIDKLKAKRAKLSNNDSRETGLICALFHLESLRAPGETASELERPTPGTDEYYEQLGAEIERNPIGRVKAEPSRGGEHQVPTDGELDELVRNRDRYEPATFRALLLKLCGVFEDRPSPADSVPSERVAFACECGARWLSSSAIDELSDLVEPYRQRAKAAEAERDRLQARVAELEADANAEPTRGVVALKYERRAIGGSIPKIPEAPDTRHAVMGETPSPPGQKPA